MEKFNTLPKKAISYFFLKFITHLIWVIPLLIIVIGLTGWNSTPGVQSNVRIMHLPFFWNGILFFSLVWFLFSLIWAYLTYLNWGYFLNQREIVIKRGVIYKKKIVIPYSRIQNVDQSRGIVNHLTGLVDIMIFTAGTGVSIGEGYIPALLPDTTESLQKEILEKMPKIQPGL